MNCRGWNPHIALHVEGDLDPDMAVQVESHLTSCVECRDFADMLRQTQFEVRQLRGDTIEISSLNRVRANVLQQVRAIEQRRNWMDRAAIWLWGGFRYRYALLGSVAAILVAVLIWRVSLTTVPPPQIAIGVPPLVSVPDVVAVRSEAPAPVKKAVLTRRRMKPGPVKTAAVSIEPPAPKPDTVVQILTDDPNVVIYWLIDQSGGF